MDREHVKGIADKAKGTIKDTAESLRETRSCRPKEKWTKRKEASTRRPGM
jgi:hypothetical protein